MFSIPQLATYVAFIFIVAAYAVKVAKIARMPVHLRWELYPVPQEKNYKYGGSYFEELEWWTKPRERNVIRGILGRLKEYLFFPGYYHRNKSYWFGVFFWHTGFYLLVSFIILSFLSALATVTPGLSIASESTSTLGRMLYYLMLIAAVGSFTIGAIGSLGLLVKKLADKDLRAYASPLDYFSYIFFLVLFVALFFLWYYDPTLSSYRDFWKSLITFKSIDVAPATYAFVMLFALHLIHLPFTRSTHYITKIFAFFNVLWDDTPNRRGITFQKKIKKVFDKRVSWAAPHIQSGLKWGEVVKGLPQDRKPADEK